MKRYFTFKGTPTEVQAHIKWCRQSLGTRGPDWDFAGNYHRVHIEIKKPESITFYTLKYGDEQTS